MTDLRSVMPDQLAALPDASSPAKASDERHLRYRPTRQNRSADSERRLLKAAELLFKDNGYTHTKISDIIRISGVSTGSFYHRFGDKSGLKDVLVSRFVTAANKIIDNLDAGRDIHGNLPNLLRWLAALMYETMTANQGIYRIVDELSKSEPEKWESFRHMGERVRDRVLSNIDQYSDELSVPETETMTAMTNVLQLMIVVILQTRLGAASMFPSDRDQLIDMLVSASMGILQKGK